MKAGLYRGLLPPVLAEAPKRATKFGANEQYSALYKRLAGVDKMTQSLSLASGVSTGITEACIIVPFELVKIRLQDKASVGKYSGTWDALFKIIRQEGPLALYNGLEATIWRHAVWNGGFFGSIFSVREVMPKATTKNGKRLQDFTAGTIGGTIGTLLNTPFDVVKTRIQNQINEKGGAGGGGALVKNKYGWTLPSIAIVYREEGFKALYKGFVPKVLRLGPGGGIILLVFEAFTGFVRKYVIVG